MINLNELPPINLNESANLLLKANSLVREEKLTGRDTFQVETFSSKGKRKIPVMDDTYGVLCYSCGVSLSLDEVKNLWLQDEIRCSCGKILQANAPKTPKGLYGTGWNIAIPRKESYLAVEAENVSKVKWYHVTERENWLDECNQNNAAIHVGSLKSALLRYIHFWLNLPLSEPKFYMYEVSLKPDTVVHPYVYLDENLWTDRLPSNVGRSFEQKALRYVNVWEGSGDVSLFLPSQSLVLEDKQALK